MSTLNEKAQDLVTEHQKIYESQVKSGRYLCDKPICIREAIEIIENDID